MKNKKISFATFNLYNLNEPGLKLYKNSKPWTQEEYDRKIAFSAAILRIMKSDVFAFQELWHKKSLENLLTAAGMDNEYEPLVPDDHNGKRIVCASAVRKDLLQGKPEWLKSFPDDFKLRSKGDDPQTPAMSVNIKSYSRPVLKFKVRPREDESPIHVFVPHFKSKAPTWITKESWYSKSKHGKHNTAIGYAISTIRRTAEALALRMEIIRLSKNKRTPIIVLGDVNDDTLSNTVNILTGQPNYLMGFSEGGADVGMYTAQTLQEYRSTRDVYYTHIHKNNLESLDQILVSEELYDNSRRRVWSFEGLRIANDHLDDEDHRLLGTNDHGVVRVEFKYNPAKEKPATS